MNSVGTPEATTDPAVAQFLDTEAFQKLGAAVERKARQANYDETVFCEIASESLEGFESPLKFDPPSITEFVRSHKVRQKAFLEFSDLPITLFSNENFYIEALFWFTSSTAIHSHGFSGAFKVAKGSSLHSKYSFLQQRSHSERALEGELNCRLSEILTEGCVRPIAGGINGSIHSLFHIQQPSISLLIRTHTCKQYQPQYSFHLPGLALDSFGLAKDAETKLQIKLLSLCRTHKPEELQKLATSQAEQLDFSRLSWLILRSTNIISNLQDINAFWRCVERKHGGKSELIRAAFDRQCASQRLQNLRSVTDDRNIRFFLACLLNAPDRQVLIDLICEGRPSNHPSHFIAKMLWEISKLSPNPKQLLSQMSSWQNMAEYQVAGNIAPML